MRPATHARKTTKRGVPRNPRNPPGSTTAVVAVPNVLEYIKRIVVCVWCLTLLMHLSPPSPILPPPPLLQVCTHICRCFRVSAQFETCRVAITEVPVILKDICRILYYKVCRDIVYVKWVINLVI